MKSSCHSWIGGLPHWLMAFVFIFAPMVQGHVRPSPAQLEEARQKGDLEERLAFMKALGNDRMSPELVERAQNKITRAGMEAAGYDANTINSFAPPPALKGLPTTGSPKVLTLLFDFADNRAPAAPSPADFAANLYGNGTTAAQAFFPFESMNRYYNRASEGLLNLSGNVLGWYNFPNNRSTYQPAAGADAWAQNKAIFDMMKVAMDSYNASHDFAQYDNDNDGYIDAVTMMYTGNPGAWSSFWWAYQWSFFTPEASTKTWDGKKVNKFVFQFVSKRGTGSTDYDPKVMCHEMGHLLGLADYYDYTPATAPKGGVGGLDMMDANKGNHNAFSRWVMDWITPTPISGLSTTPQLKTLNASGDTTLQGNKAVVIFPTAPSPFSQFFIIENRHRIGNDAGQSFMPSDGLLIWHVDATLQGNDFKYDNSDTTPKLIKLVQADGLNQIDTGGSADAADYFVTGKSFTATSNPNSNSHQGNVTNVSVTNISANNRIMTAMIGFGTANTQVVATPVITPGGGLMTAPTPVTITCDTAGATIRYTLDGSSPTTSSPVYSAPITVSATTTVRAKATKSAMTDSAIASATFTFNGTTILADGVTKSGLSGALGSAAYFVINVPAGETKLEIKTSGGTGDVDMYVRQGALPTLSTYDLRPYQSGNNETATISNPAAGNWYIMLHGYAAYSSVSLLADHSRLLAKVATPVFSPVPGTYNGQVSVVISCATTGATIRYTTDRTDPTASSPIYTAPVLLTASNQLRARAFFPSYTDSDVKLGDYTINNTTAITNLADGVTLTGRSGTVSSVTYYKLEVPADQSSLLIKTSGGTGDCDLYVRRGSLPTTSTYDYRPYAGGNNEEVAVTNPVAGTWYVMLHGYTAYSGVSLLGDYTRVLGIVATPLFSPAPGAYTGSVAVSLSCATPGATVRYTTNGTVPTSTSLVYAGPITLTAASTTVKAQAFKTDYTNSAVASGVYTVTAGGGLTTLTDGVSKTGLSGTTGSERHFLIRVPVGQNKLVVKTSGGTGDCDLYIRRASEATTTTYDYRPYLSGNNESVEIINPAADDWYIMLRGFSAYSSVSLLADYSVNPVPAATPVFSPNGGTFSASPVVVTMTSTTPGATIYYTINGPTPTTGSTVYDPYNPLTLTTNGTYLVKAIAVKDGYTDSAVKSATFTVNAITVTQLTDGVSKTGITGTLSSERYYRINVPAGMAKLIIKTSGGTGDCDLYVKQGTTLPTLSVYDYRPFASGNSEEVTINNPTAGDWSIMLHGYSAYSSVSLLGDYVPALANTNTPTFSPAAGTYNTLVKVTLACTTTGATIRYTTNGAEPDADSTPYTGPLTLTTTTTVKAKAFKAGNNDSGTATATYTITGPTIVNLTDGAIKSSLSGAQGSQAYFKISVPSGQAKVDFKISGGTGDCDIYVRYGNIPDLGTWDYRPYTGGNVETVTVNTPNSGDWYIMLRGFAAFSGVTLVADYTDTLLTVADPVINPTGFSYAPPLSVTMTCATTSSTIRYTTDGNDPTGSSPVYTGAFSITAVNTAVTVKAKAFRAGYNDSAVVTRTYSMTSPPVTLLTDGVSRTGQAGSTGSELFFKINVPSNQARLVIKISGGTGDCDMYIRHGSAPSLSTWTYRPYLGGNSETVTIDQPTSGEWYVMLQGYTTYSGVALLADYTTGTVVAPVFSPAPGTYATLDPVMVTLSSTTPGADIRYTTDGTTVPSDTVGLVYTGPITLTSTTSIKAVASKANYFNSTVVTGNYTITPPPVTILADGVAQTSISGAVDSKRLYKITVPSGQIKLEVKITGSTGDCDLYVRYGAQPTEALWDFRPYSGGSNETVVASNPAAGDWYIMLDGYTAYSGVSLVADHATTLGTVINPVFNPGTLTSSAPVTVNLACATVGATIRYTVDGSEPNGSSTPYTGPITVNSTTTVKAIGTLLNYTNSGVVTAVYTINGPSITNLALGTPVNSISGALNSARYYKITIPSGLTSASFAISGGTGDCDLYLRMGSSPTLDDWDERPYLGGSTEEVVLTAPAAGDYYIMLHGYSAYSGVSLLVQAQTTTITSLGNPGSASGVSGVIDSMKFYKITVPAGQTELNVSITGGLGDCDVYVRRGAPPTLSTWDYRPFMDGNEEQVSVLSPTAGEWYIMLYGFGTYDFDTGEVIVDGYSGVTLNAGSN